MLKLMFVPFRLVGGLLAGAFAKKLFERIWRLIDKEQAPEPEQRRISLGKLAAALVLEGAVFRAVRGLFDHGSRVAFSRVTGRWPGEKRAKDAPEQQPTS
jgi:Protein of unknown function (DUF4235)